MARRRKSRGGNRQAVSSRAVTQRRFVPPPLVRLPPRRRTSLLSPVAIGRKATSARAIFARRTALRRSSGASLLTSYRAADRNNVPNKPPPRVRSTRTALRPQVEAVLVRGNRSPKRRACKCSSRRSVAQKVVSRAFYAGYGGRGTEPKKVAACSC